MQSVTQNCTAGFLQKLFLCLREGGIVLLSLKKCKENQIPSSLLDLTFNTYSTHGLSVIVGFCPDVFLVPQRKETPRFRVVFCYVEHLTHSSQALFKRDAQEQ